MSGIFFLLFASSTIIFLFLIPNYVCIFISKKIALNFSKTKYVNIINFKRQKFLIFSIFRSDVEFFEEYKNKKDPHPQSQKISTQFAWLLWFFRKEQAEKFLFNMNSAPCTLDFYVFKIPFSSRYKAAPIQTFEKIYKRNLRFSNIITISIILFLIFMFGKLFTSELLMKQGFTRIESLEASGRVAKTMTLKWLHEKRAITGEEILSIFSLYLNEICADASERSVCQKRDDMQKVLENLPTGATSAPDSGL
jgi:hypothetical protein